MLDARDLLGPVTGTREQNRRKLIIEIMIKADRQSRIARRMGLSQGSVSTAVQELVEEEIVEVRRERRGSSVLLKPTRGIALGIDLGFRRTAVIARRVDHPFEHVSRVVRAEEGANRGFAQVLPTIRRMISEAVEETGQKPADIVSAGIAVPRMINPREGRFTTPVLPPWNAEDDPAKVLGRELKVHVAIDNDANLGAMAEQTYGLEEPIETVVYVKASTGVGAGIMIGDKLLRGERGMAGEIGHLLIDRDGEVCLCGGRGCLDTVVGAEALLAEARQASRRSGYDAPSSLTLLIENARRGDAVCRRILGDAGRTLGQALAQLCNLVNPRLIVLGGELAGGDELVLEPCVQELRHFALAGAVGEESHLELRRSNLNSLAEAQGALILGLRSRQLESAGDGAPGGDASN
jgi:predicted NBD/HSP70 family sugar kinase